MNAKNWSVIKRIPCGNVESSACITLVELIGFGEELLLLFRKECLLEKQLAVFTIGI